MNQCWFFEPNYIHSSLAGVSKLILDPGSKRALSVSFVYSPAVLSPQVGSDLFSIFRVTCPRSTFAGLLRLRACGTSSFFSSPQRLNLFYSCKNHQRQRSLRNNDASLSFARSFILFSPSVRHVQRDIHEWYNSRPFRVFLNYLSSIEMQLDWSSFEVWTSFLTPKGCIKWSFDYIQSARLSGAMSPI